MIAYSTCAAEQTINFVVVCRPAGRANYQYVTFQILNLPISILLKATTLFFIKTKYDYKQLKNLKKLLFKIFLRKYDYKSLIKY